MSSIGFVVHTPTWAYVIQRTHCTSSTSGLMACVLKYPSFMHLKPPSNMLRLKKRGNSPSRRYIWVTEIIMRGVRESSNCGQGRPWVQA